MLLKYVITYLYIGDVIGPNCIYASLANNKILQVTDLVMLLLSGRNNKGPRVDP